MRMSQNENRIISDLREEVLDELRGEDVGIQIWVAVGVLAEVIVNCSKRDPQATTAAIQELQRLMNVTR